MPNNVSLAALPGDDIYGLDVDVTRTSPVDGVFSIICGASDNATVVTTTKTEVRFVNATTINSGPAYIKFYNTPVSSPFTPTYLSTPSYRTMVPGWPAGGKEEVSFHSGPMFTTGLSVRVSTGITDIATVAPSADQVIVNVGYSYRQ